MKAIILSLLLTSVNAQQLPSHWFEETTKANKENNLTSLESYMDKLLSVQENVLEKGEKSFNKGLGDWVLDGQKTDLAVSKSGLFGFAAVKATKAIELSWSKVSQDKSDEVSPSDISLTSSMTEEQVLMAVRPSYKVLLKNLPSREYSWRAKNFEDHVLRYHRAMKEVSSLQTGKYVPEKFRLDMSVSYSSPLFGFTRLSGDTRLRLEWKIVPSADKNLQEKDQKVVRKILEDVDRALEDVEVQEGYKLKSISIGLGLSQKNLLSFTKVKGSIAGHLFLKKVTGKSLSPATELNDSYEWNNPEGDKILGLFKRAKFRKGIRKSFKVSSWFSKQFSGRESQWIIKKFKTSFSISYSGFLGLSGTSSSSAVSFTYSK